MSQANEPGKPANTSEEEGKNTAGDGQGGEKSATPAGSSEPQSGDTSQAGKSTEKTFTQEQVDQIAAEARKQARAAAQKQLEEAEAQKKGEFERLYTETKAERDALQTKAELADRYSALLNEHMEARIADWPDEVKDLDPGAEDVDARMKWMQKAEPMAKKLKQLPEAPPTDAGRGSRPTPQRNQGEGARQPTQTYRFQSEGDVRW